MCQTTKTRGMLDTFDEIVLRPGESTRAFSLILSLSPSPFLFHLSSTLTPLFSRWTVVTLRHFKRLSFSLFFLPALISGMFFWTPRRFNRTQKRRKRERKNQGRE